MIFYPGILSMQVIKVQSRTLMTYKKVNRYNFFLFALRGYHIQNIMTWKPHHTAFQPQLFRKQCGAFGSRIWLAGWLADLSHTHITLLRSLSFTSIKNVVALYWTKPNWITELGLGSLLYLAWLTRVPERKTHLIIKFGAVSLEQEIFVLVLAPLFLLRLTNLIRCRPNQTFLTFSSFYHRVALSSFYSCCSSSTH